MCADVGEHKIVDWDGEEFDIENWDGEEFDCLFCAAGAAHICSENEEVNEEMAEQTTQVPVTGPQDQYQSDIPEYGHVDRTAQVRRVMELGLEFAHQYQRLQGNLAIDRKAAEDDEERLSETRLRVMTILGESGG